jgi:hypothetical protein
METRTFTNTNDKYLKLGYAKEITLTQNELDLMFEALEGTFCAVPSTTELHEIENDHAIRLVCLMPFVEKRTEILKKELDYATQQANKYQDFLSEYKKISERLIK